MMDFTVTQGSVDDSTHIVEPHGEIDRATAPELEHALEGACTNGKHRLIVDLADVPFIDSSGLGTLLSTQRRLLGGGCTLVTVCPDPIIRRLFEVTDTLALLNVKPSLREALAYEPALQAG